MQEMKIEIMKENCKPKRPERNGDVHMCWGGQIDVYVQREKWENEWLEIAGTQHYRLKTRV
jgi:hypothetical protein